MPPNTKLIVSITLLVEWTGHPVGVVRTIYELVQYLHTNEKDVVFCYFPAGKSELVPLAPSELEMLLHRFSHAKKDAPKAGITQSLKWYIKTFSVRKLLAIFPPSIQHFLLHNRLVLKAWHRYAAHKRAASRSQANETQTVFSASDHLLLLDILAPEPCLAWLYEMKKQYQLQVSAIGYDVIPLSHSHYFEGLSFVERFEKWFYHLNHVCDKIICISEAAKKGFITENAKRHYQHQPRLHTITLGDTIQSEGKAPAAPLPANFILYVSTIEIRKNHKTLLDAYLLAEQRGIAMSDLLCVGRQGWKVDALYQQYHASPYLMRKIHFLHNISDEELAYLYRKCLFCVFPSDVEGWGLAAAEALGYGKICLLSEDPALYEASRGLMPQISTFDAEKWLQSIQDFSTNTTLRQEYETSIAEHYTVRHWEDFAKECYDFLKEA